MSTRKTISLGKAPPKNPPVQGAVTVGVAEFRDGLEGTHVGGTAIEDIDPAMRQRLFFQQTDEGVEEANAGKVESSARVTKDPLAKALEQKRDFGMHGNEPWLAPDPMRALAEGNVPAGMRPRFLSETRLNKEGNFSRGFEVVLRNGEPVKLGTLVLAIMPEELAEKRNRHYQDKANAALAEVNSTTKQKGDGLIRTARELGLASDPREDTQQQQGANF
jgi:hypothetical protein